MVCAVDAVFLHLLDEGALADRIFLGVGHQHGAPERIERPFDARHHFREIGIGEVVDAKPDHASLPGAQGGGTAIVDVADLGRGLLHPLAGLGLDQRAVPQHQGHGRHGHTGPFGDVANGDARHGTPPLNGFTTMLMRFPRIQP